MTAGRDAAIDAVRALAMLAIVAGHLWGDGLPRTLIFSWHVPVFFFLSGYLWKRGRGLGGELRGRALTLLVPYAVWIVIVQLLVVPVLVARGQINPVDLPSLILGGRAAPTPYWTIWFVTALFFATVWMRLLERLPPAVPWITAIAGMIAVGLYPDLFSQLPLSLGQSVVGLFYLLAGAAFSTLRQRVRIAWPWAFVAVVGGLLLAEWSRGGMDLKVSRLGAPVLGVVVSLLISAGLLVLAERVLRGTSERVATVVTEFGVATLVVLFVHMPLGYLLRLDGDSRSPLGFLLICALSWAIGLVLLRLPRTWPLTGVGAPVRTRRVRLRGQSERPST